MNNKGATFGTREEEGMERATILFMVPTAGGNVTYRCYRWSNFGSHWVLETPNGDQVEVWGAQVYMIHIPKPGWTFETDGTSRELQRTGNVILQ